MLAVTPSLLDNPRFLAMQIRQIYQRVAPAFIRPILQQGMDDGTIKIHNPDELAEAIMILLQDFNVSGKPGIIISFSKNVCKSLVYN